MGSIFGGKSDPPPAPLPPPPPAPIPSAPIADPIVKDTSDPEVQDKAKRARVAAARRKGRASTILTSSQGVTEDDNVRRKVLGNA